MGKPDKEAVAELARYVRLLAQEGITDETKRTALAILAKMNQLKLRYDVRSDDD